MTNLVQTIYFNIAGHTWIDIWPVQQELEVFWSMHGCSHSWEVDLSIGFPWTGLLVDFCSISTGSQSTVVLIHVFWWQGSPATKIQWHSRRDSSTSNVWMWKSEKFFTTLWTWTACSLSYIQYTEMCSSIGMWTFSPTPGTILRWVEHRSAIHRELCIIWMNVKLSLNGWGWRSFAHLSPSQLCSGNWTRISRDTARTQQCTLYVAEGTCSSYNAKSRWNGLWNSLFGLAWVKARDQL